MDCCVDVIVERMTPYSFIYHLRLIIILPPIGNIRAVWKPGNIRAV